MRAAVTAVIVNHNAGELLFDCLQSALSQAAEVVLVDNASDPRRFEPVLARLGAQPRLHVIRSAENRGFAAGCNLGAQRSTQPLVLLLNPDCVLGPGTLAQLCAAIGEQPRTALVGGLLTYADGREQGGGRRAVPTPWRSFVRAFGLARLSRRWPKLFDDFHLHQQPLPASPLPVEAISGACMLISREAIEDIGLMDEGYFLHCEDLDLCMRARGRGWRILFVPDAPVVHFKGGCSRERPVFVEWHKHRGMVRFYQKHFRHQYPAGLMELVILSVWLRFAAIATRYLARGLRDRVRRAAGTAWTGGFWAGRPRAGGGPDPRSTHDTAGLPFAVASRPLTS
ncbi:MAG: glycosyltransferase family 2 protein [Planctomycetia bacterium]